MKNMNDKQAAATAPRDKQSTRVAALERLFPTPEKRNRFLDSSANIVISGLPESGKTSIVKVVFHKASPHETIGNRPTSVPDVFQITNTRLINFCLVDLPGFMLLDPQYDEVLFPKTSALVFVLDAQNDPYDKEIANCTSIFRRAWRLNPQIHFDMFIHKVDGDVFSVDDVRAECQREVRDLLMTKLHEDGVNANVLFYTTSIYDHTVFEACSRVVQRLIPEANTLEELLDLLVASCKIEKAFLIDVLSKTFIATDTSPFDPFNYELCSDMVEVVIELSCVYGQPRQGNPDDSGNANPHGSSSHGKRTVGGPAGTENSGPNKATSSLIHLNNDYVLYLKEIDRLVALACVIRGENFDRQHLIDYNIRVFRQSMLRLFAKNMKNPNETLGVQT